MRHLSILVDGEEAAQAAFAITKLDVKVASFIHGSTSNPDYVFRIIVDKSGDDFEQFLFNLGHNLGKQGVRILEPIEIKIPK